jgi:hypothetical protein
MLKTISVTGLFLLMFGLLAGCGSSPQSQGEGKVTNAELAQKVRSQLNSDPEVAAARLSIDTDAAKNTVILAGTASSEVRTKAVSLAQGALPGLSVKDAIQVTAPPVAETPKAAAKKPAKKAPTARKPARRRR